MRNRWRDLGRSRVLAAALAIAGLVALALAVGLARADPSSNAGYQVTVCQNGHTIAVNHAALEALLAQGAAEGPCD